MIGQLLYCIKTSDSGAFKIGKSYKIITLYPVSSVPEREDHLILKAEGDEGRSCNWTSTGLRRHFAVFI